MITYPHVQLFIDGAWSDGAGGRTIEVLNPCDERVIGTVAHAETEDLDRALAAADRGFRAWRRVPAIERAKVMVRAADILDERAAQIAPLITMEHGKTLREARGELAKAVDLIRYFAAEAVRTYGRIIPARADNIQQIMVMEPIGVIAGFTPWNFPVNQLVRKIGVTLAAGCAIVAKAAEETPASGAALVRAFADAGLPAGVLNLVFGVPAEVSAHLIPSPIVRKVSFTGSTAVGKELAALAGRHMKRVTMELGGHAPAIVFADANLDKALDVLAGNKTRTTGQSCIAPTRLLVHDDVFEAFTARYVERMCAVTVGDGLDERTKMGPLANPRRLHAMQRLVGDAVAHGARLLTGGERIGNRGYFFQPTVLTQVPNKAKAMNEEPFGPLTMLRPFRHYEEAVAEANRLPYGLAAYAYTGSLRTAQAIAADIESGMVSINHHGVGVPETPFGGIKDSGYGTEGGPEAVGGYMTAKFVTQSV
jgi:succinate-semialdehyde dehydrogenase/glutarate-semialdehyde dehydrogenase